MNGDYMKYFEVAPEVAQALKNGDPVVALESSIISHGMPYPTNLEVAQMAEDEVRANGAVPATIGIYKGKIVIGMDADQRYAICNRPGDPDAVAMKSSLKGIPYAITMKKNAGFTIAAIVRAASMVGIRFMATGGIGGVSWGGESSMDVSADLKEFYRTPMAVISAGCKSILDIGRTKEVLETLDVPVIGLGCDSLPAFFTPKSKYRIDYRLDGSEQAADFLHVKWELGFEGSVMLCNPVPEQYAMDEDVIEGAIAEATRLAKESADAGENNTPFLLAKVCELTNGDSLRTNVEVIRNNAKVAAQICRCYYEKY